MREDIGTKYLTEPQQSRNQKAPQPSERHIFWRLTSLLARLIFQFNIILTRNFVIHPKPVAARCAGVFQQPVKLGLFAIAAMLLGMPCISKAETQFTVGSIIRGFELPQSDAQGKLHTKIKGSEALVISANQIKISGLTIEIYDDKEQVATLINSTECTYWRMENKLTTDKPIQVQREGMTIYAGGMEWELADSKGTFRNQVKVSLKTGVFNP